MTSTTPLQNSDASESSAPPSLIDQIIQTSHESAPIPTDAGSTSDASNIPDGTVPPKKPRDPMTAGMVFKLIGSLLLVAVIFFGSFLTYIVFNPDQAAFFVNIFGINPNDIKALLKSLINGSFFITVLICSIVWIMSLFRAIWTPRDQKRRRLISWLSASVIGIFLFSILALWAFLFRIINATDYANPGGDVTIYDNDLYTHPSSLEYARIYTTTNLVGPITLRYDLSTNAKAISKKNLLTIESYEINFDGAKCANNTSSMNGSDPTTEQGLICTFDQIRTYNIRGSYSGRDRLGTIHTITIPLSTVEIKGLITITPNINKDGQKIITLDASKVKNLGNPRWINSNSGSIEKAQSSITETVSNTPLLICLKLIDTACDRYFIMSDTDTKKIEGSLLFEQDPLKPLSVTMTLTGTTLNQNEIVSIEWKSDDENHICQGTNEQCIYAFLNYGTKHITATIHLANGDTYPIQGTLVINEPLIVARHAQLQDQDGKIQNTAETYDPTVGAYIIHDMTVPSQITLDAQDVVAENLGYKLSHINWKIFDGNTTTELVGEKVVYTISRTARYTIEADYTFEKNIVVNTTDIHTAKDIIILDLEHKSLEPVLHIQQSSDYIPAKITVDASSSRSKNGTIKKFVFDFGEGRLPAEGDAIQTYEYRTPGEKKITLTIIDNNNEQISISKYIVLKDAPKNLAFTTSMSPGIVNSNITFTADGTTGQIEEYIWNFGDNTPISKGYEVDHAFAQTGQYNITLTIRYTDGTEKMTTQSLSIHTSLE